MILTRSKKGLSILCDFEAFFVMRCMGHGRSGTRMGSKINDYILMNLNIILVLVLLP
jgi:hypothetical protein